MSSTSGEVCELFNNTGIVRTIGRPVISQLVFLPEQYETSTDGTLGIHTIETAASSKGENVMVQQGMHYYGHISLI